MKSSELSPTLYFLSVSWVAARLIQTYLLMQLPVVKAGKKGQEESTRI